MRRAVILVVLLSFSTWTVHPAGAENAASVTLVSFSPDGVRVETARYSAALSWPAEGEDPTERPVWGTLALADGRTLAFEERLALIAATPRGQTASETALAAGAPGAYRVTLLGAQLAEETTTRVQIQLDYAFLGLPAVDENVTGRSTFAFTVDRIDHEYGYRFPSEVSPAVLVNDTFAFSRPYSSRLSVNPVGSAVADDGESLDGYATWKSYQPYGILFTDADSDVAFDFHRVNSTDYVNYLGNGRFRSASGGVSHVTIMNDHEWQRTIPSATVGSGRGVAAHDAWLFPASSITPVELAAVYHAPPGGGNGGGNDPTPPPPNDASPFPLRCPDFPAKPETLGTCERVVVAVLDSGANVYHQWFRRPGWTTHPSTYLDGFPADAPALPLTFGGDLAKNKRDDAAVLAGLERERLYTLPGTAFVGAISFGEYEAGGATPLIDEMAIGHGTATAGAAVAVNPDVLLVLVEIGLDDPGEFDRAIEWVTRQPWIDVVSMSMGSLGNIGTFARAVGSSKVHPEGFTRALWDQGRLVVVAAGNDGSVTLTDSWDGPPWTIAIGGDLERASAAYSLSAKIVDVTSDYKQTLPSHKTVYGRVSQIGTSFATPRVAGTLSRAILDARITTGHAGGIEDGALVPGRATNADFRDAMNATAVWFDTADFSGAGADEVPIAPAAPWLQMGWGHVGPDQAAAIASVALGEKAPAKPAEASTYMAGMHRIRQALWSDTYPAWGPLVEEKIDP